ncbi:MAG: hypothetical protein JST86_15800 [Bacteroidetes bacterium]|nr:hypothetical protein [Bacteroidota bacterium]
MKKAAAILLLMIYSLSTMGIGIRQFYCCGKLKSTTITLVQEDKEKCASKGSMTGCCKTTFKNFKVKDSHVGSSNTFVLNKVFTAISLPEVNLQAPVLAVQHMLTGNYSKAPPPLLPVSLNILYCVYRI